MINKQVVSSTIKRRILQFCILSLLMGVSFALGATLTAVVTARILLPRAAAGMVMGLVGLTYANLTATIDALHTGDSETRKIALVSLKQSFPSQGQTPIAPELTTLLLPALGHCMVDEDPEVVALANEVKMILQGNTPNQP